MEKINKFWFWFTISCALCLYYGLVSSYYAFSQDYIVQDDARQHVVWLQKFSDAELFPNDLIANYYLNLAPLGYKTLYVLAAKIGIQALILAKILPIILGLIATIYIFLFAFQILPLPFSSFVITLLFNQVIWLQDDLISATPRAFLYPLFAAFLYYLSVKQLIPCLVVMFIQGLFYPQILLIENTILFLNLFTNNRKNQLRLTVKKQDYILFFSSILVTLIIAIFFRENSPESQAFLSLAKMREMPEFGLHGRNKFFGVSTLYFWFKGRSGINLPFFPTVVWLSIILPLFLHKKIGITKFITKKIVILNYILISSFVLFFLAHLFLPKLYLPSRFTYHSLRFLIAIASGIVITTVFDLSHNWLKKRLKAKHHFNFKEKSLIGLISFLFAIIIIFPLFPPVFIDWYHNWVVGEAKPIYEFLAQKPKNILVASLSTEVNNIPAFTERSILVGREFALAYHPIYHNKIKTRVIDLLNAQYTVNFELLTNIITKYNISYFLLEKNSFSPDYLKQQNWLIYSSWQEVSQQIINELNQDKIPILTNFIESCKVLSTENLYLVDANCILKHKN